MNRKTIQLFTLTAIVASAFALQSFQNKPTTTMSKKEEKLKTVSITKKGEVINVSAADLWKIVGDDFANAGKWATSIDHSEGSGTPEFEGATCSNRGCELNAKGFSSIKEKLTQYDAENHQLAYEVYEGFPGFVTLGRNHWTIESITPTSSRVTMQMTMKMKPFMGALMGGMMKKNINTLLPIVLNDLKVYAETGEVSESKKARIASLK